MTVTAITEVSKKQCKICLDYELCFVLYKGELRQYGIAEGEELPEETRHKVLEELLPRRAKLRAMNLLQRRDYTERQLKDNLLPDHGDSLSEHNIKLRLLKGRSDLVLNHLNTGMVSDDLTALL